MAATLQSIRKRAKIAFQSDMAAPQATVDPFYNDLINQYCRELASLTHWKHSVSTVLSAAGQHEYVVSGVSVEAVWYIETRLKESSFGELEALGFNFLDETNPNAQGTPIYWYGTDQGFGLYPVPANSGDTIRFLVDNEASSLANDSDATNLPDRAVDAVVEGVKYGRALQLGDPRIGVFLQQYERAWREAAHASALQVGPTTYTNPDQEGGLLP